jgi:hypothetical protein
VEKTSIAFDPEDGGMYVPQQHRIFTEILVHSIQPEDRTLQNKNSIEKV